MKIPKTIRAFSRIGSSKNFARRGCYRGPFCRAVDRCKTAATGSLPLTFRFAIFTFDFFSCQGKHYWGFRLFRIGRRQETLGMMNIKNRWSWTTEAIASVRKGFPLVLAASISALSGGCNSRQSTTVTEPALPPSSVRVTLAPNQVVMDSPAAEFAVLPSGYVTAALLKPSRQSLDS